MILSAQSIAMRGLISPCEPRTREHGLTYGLGPAGYDLRLDLGDDGPFEHDPLPIQTKVLRPGDFILAATLERFKMDDDILGLVCDKSSLARRGLSVFNTVIEPGWRGFLTLELKNQGHEDIQLVRGQAIAQVVFQVLDKPTVLPYDGKYQDQEPGPQGARF